MRNLMFRTNLSTLRTLPVRIISIVSTEFIVEPHFWMEPFPPTFCPLVSVAGTSFQECDRLDYEQRVDYSGVQWTIFATSASLAPAIASEQAVECLSTDHHDHPQHIDYSKICSTICETISTSVVDQVDPSPTINWQSADHLPTFGGPRLGDCPPSDPAGPTSNIDDTCL